MDRRGASICWNVTLVATDLAEGGKKKENLLDDLKPSLSELVCFLLEVLLQPPLDFIRRVVCPDSSISYKQSSRTIAYRYEQKVPAGLRCPLS